MAQKNQAQDDDPRIVTSIRMRKSVRLRVKVYAAERGTTVQEVIENALMAYIDKN